MPDQDDIASIETPWPVVDLDRVERNLSAMQDYCNRHGLLLRPHIKTHKLTGFARRQVELGAVGICCQKLSEAEIMLDAGIGDIFITYPPIGAAKQRRLAVLAPRGRIIVAIDSPQALAVAAAAARTANAEIGIMIEFDSGMGRTGVRKVEDALALAASVIRDDRLRFCGLMTYPANQVSVDFVEAARASFSASGIAIPLVSGGGTPNAMRTHELKGIGELRVGTYIYHDRNTVRAGAATFGDCALHVHATVISRPTAERAIIDAGSKTLTSDLVAGDRSLGFGHIEAYPQAVIVALSEEHGMVDLSACTGHRPEIGERLAIVPNHVCPVSNLHDDVVAVRGGGIVGRMAVSARGTTR
jgi:D-serine deaminase-like pyridoxal phosphate-dependent protein